MTFYWFIKNELKKHGQLNKQLNWSVACSSCAVKKTRFGTIIVDCIVHGTAVVPHQDVSFSPAMAVDIFLPSGQLIEPVKQ
jgi:hypothetical protein